MLEFLYNRFHEEDIVLEPVAPTEYFRGLVEAAMRKQQVVAGDLTSFYVVNLLTGFVRRSEAEPEVLGIKLLNSLGPGRKQRDALRQVADLSLVMAGFFSDSLTRSLVDPDYYVQLGSYAYGSLANGDDLFSEAYDELSGKFVPFVDVLSEVSSTTRVSSEDQDRLRLYERWLYTGSTRAAAKLIEHGITPNAALRKAFLQ
jgi:hypothetical protein